MMNHRQTVTELEPRWPEDGLEPVPACPVCGEARRETLYEGLTDRVFFCAPGEWALHRCLGCRSAYLDPRPTPETIALAYRNYFTHEPSGEETAARPQAALAGLKIRLRNGYLNHRYKLTLKPASPLGRWVIPWFPLRRNGIEYRLRNMAALRPGARLLDVGCGNGDFLRTAFRMGWEARGLEPDPSAVAAARSAGLPVQQGHLPETGLPDDHLDAVTLSHAVEHLHDPVRSLRELYRILAPGGKLWMATPNLESPLHRYFGWNWLHLDPPRHLVLFNRCSLVAACRRSGFGSVALHAQLPCATWLIASSRSVEHGAMPPFGNASFRLNLADRLRALSLDLAAVLRPEWGEELVVVATKPLQAGCAEARSASIERSI